ncbi:MAG: hypothetical protein K2M97_02450, partial [Muribaculaceae bacterium]|nr:hypothetical protein [Muribaculaceae bacterium]
MRNFFKTLSIAAAITTLMPAASHAFFRVSDPMTDLPDGAIVALQSPSTTGGSYYFFNGAAHKTAP